MNPLTPEYVHKVSVVIPISNELMRDMGLIGDREIPDGARWRALWQQHQPFTYFPIGAHMAPPWEYWDRPWLRSFDPFPRWTKAQSVWREVRRRTARARQALRDREPEDDDW